MAVSINQPCRPFSLLAELGEFVLELRQGDIEIGDLEDRGLFVLLMATMTFGSFMPARCWMAPEMPTAM
ncbi:hypothetical protein BA190_17380 [Labrys sp. WJW]|nr:hypothetical protein BA190_17380 [Labrys sp. WJW]